MNQAIENVCEESSDMLSSVVVQVKIKDIDVSSSWLLLFSYLIIAYLWSV